MTRHDSATILRRTAFAVILPAFLAAGCANIGTPSGGPRDEDPPYLVRANPAPGATNVTRTNIELTFNELVNVKDAFDKVVLSPAGRPPRVTSQGSKVIVQFDSLAPGTTYTVDFADAIEDNNEANKLQNFAYTFSTGGTLDSLRISGRVFGSRDLEPRPGILVGITDNLSDTAFLRTPLIRIAKTDDRGQFTVRGLAPGTYRVFALGDKDNDFTYSSCEEEVAFYDVPVTPSTTRRTVTDSIYNTLTGAVDSTRERERTVYLPNDVLLRTFMSSRRPQYVARHERPDSARLFLKFNATSAQWPRMRLLGENSQIKAIPESRAGMDSVTLWLPPVLAHRDTIDLVVDYSREEWNKMPESISDTIRFITKRLPAPKKKNKKSRSQAAKDSLAAITMAFTRTGDAIQEVYKPTWLETPTPLSRLDTAAIHLDVYKDSVWVPAPGRLRVSASDSLAPRSLRIDYPWEAGARYKIIADTLAGTGIYGRTTLPFETELKVRDAVDYCTLTLNISGLSPDTHAFVELLDATDIPQRSAVVQNGRASFTNLVNGRYYVRLIEDANGNGIYDTGDFAAGLQPDLAYYYPKPINIKKNWDKEETWDLWATAIDLQKPVQILKNKPKTTKRSKKQLEEEEEYLDEEEEIFDPTANPFEERNSRRTNRNGRNNRNGLMR